MGLSKILVIDDDESIRDYIDLALGSEGYGVLTAEHGAAALSLLQQAGTDLILLDMRMPIMDGWEFARAYRQLPGPHAPIVVITAAADAAARAAEIAADDYLAKPFHLDDLFACIARHSGAI